MKIFITNIEDKGEQDALLDGTCDICFEWGYYTQYLVSFCLLMSDGTVYDIAHDGVVDYNYDEDGTSDLYGYTQTGPIKNVLKFVSDIKTIDFPDIEFFESYEEYREAWHSDRMVIRYTSARRRTSMSGMMPSAISWGLSSWRSSRGMPTTAWKASTNTSKRLPRGRRTRHEDQGYVC